MTVSNATAVSESVLLGLVIPHSLEQLNELFVRHRYLPSITQCNCQYEFGEHPVDISTGYPVGGSSHGVNTLLN